MNDINFADIQQEINQAEQYLQSKQFNDKRTRGSNNSMKYEKPESQEHSTSIPNKYSTAEEREKLITRLINERNQKNSIKNIDLISENRDIPLLDLTDQVAYKLQENSNTLEFDSTNSDYLSSIRIIDNENNVYEGYNNSNNSQDNMVFYASDIHFNETISEDSLLSKEEDIENQNITLSNTIYNMETLRAKHDNNFHTQLHPPIKQYSNNYDKKLNFKQTNKMKPPPKTASSYSSSYSSSSFSSSFSSRPPPHRAHSARMYRSVSPKSEFNTNQIENKKFLKSKDDLQLEAKKQFEIDYTFQPKLVSDASIVGFKHRPDIQTRIQEMQLSHDKSLKDREKMKRDLERSELGECTFKPRIAKKTDTILKAKAEINQAILEAKQNKLKNLNKKYSKNAPEATTQKTPQVSRSFESVSDRLHEESYRRVKQQEWIEKTIDQARRNQYSFQPSINPVTSIIVGVDHPEYKPIYKRVADIQRSRSQTLHKLAHDRIQDDKAKNTFTPKIDSKSRELADKRMMKSQGGYEGLGMKAVEARLLQEGREAVRRKQQLLQNREMEIAKDMQQARPSKGTQEIAKNNIQIGNSSFYDRQSIYSKKAKEHADQRLIRESVKAEKWFKPQVTKKSEDIISVKRPEILQESNAERAQRLYHDDFQSRESRRQEIDQEVYGNLSFKPEIDPISKALGRPSNIMELYENSRGKKAKEVAQQKAEKMHSRDYTFKPEVVAYKPPPFTVNEKLKVNRSRYNVSDSVDIWGFSSPDSRRYIERDEGEEDELNEGKYRVRPYIDLKHPEKMSRDIRIKQRQKEEKIRSELAAREIEELAECTFQPQIPVYSPPSVVIEPVVIRGIGRHLELKSRKEKLLYDKAQREKQAFNVRNAHKFRKTEDGSTIVEAFKLSSSSSRTSRAVKDLELKEKSQLTFTPSTNEKNSQKAYIQKLINNII